MKRHGLRILTMILCWSAPCSFHFEVWLIFVAFALSPGAQLSGELREIRRQRTQAGCGLVNSAKTNGNGDHDEEAAPCDTVEPSATGYGDFEDLSGDVEEVRDDPHERRDQIGKE